MVFRCARFARGGSAIIHVQPTSRYLKLSLACIFPSVFTFFLSLDLGLNKTRQDNALFGVLYSPMYIDVIQII